MIYSSQKNSRPLHSFSFLFCQHLTQAFCKKYSTLYVQDTPQLSRLRDVRSRISLWRNATKPPFLHDMTVRVRGRNDFHNTHSVGSRGSDCSCNVCEEHLGIVLCWARTPELLYWQICKPIWCTGHWIHFVRSFLGVCYFSLHFLEFHLVPLSPFVLICPVVFKACSSSPANIPMISFWRLIVMLMEFSYARLGLYVARSWDHVIPVLGVLTKDHVIVVIDGISSGYRWDILMSQHVLDCCRYNSNPYRTDEIS